MINKSYGCNNINAWNDFCEVTGKKHKWKIRNPPKWKCYKEYICEDCKSTTEIDSSD